jgi:hypothetical protein
MGGNANGYPDCSHALVNLAIICRSLLVDSGLAEPVKAEATELLDAWRHLAGRNADASVDEAGGDEGHALLRRMEAFVQARAARPALVQR